MALFSDPEKIAKIVSCSSLQRKKQRSTAQSLSFDLSNTSFLVTSSLQSVINTTIFKL